MDEVSKVKDIRLLELMENLHHRLDGLENTLGGDYSAALRENQEGPSRPTMSLEDRLDVLNDGLKKAVHRVEAIRERVQVSIQRL